MEENYKAEALDIASLRVGRPPVALLPRALIDLWKDEPLPSWLVEDCKLPIGSTIDKLGPVFWDYQAKIPSRVRHFVEFLVKSRAPSVRDVLCIDRPWPVGLQPHDIPFGTRATNVLGAIGALDPTVLSELTFGRLLGASGLGVRTLLEITTLIDAAVDMHWGYAAELAKAFASPSPDSLNSRESAQATSPESPNDTDWSAMRTQLTEVLQEPWADQIDEYDPRFSEFMPPGYGTIEERVERSLASPDSASSGVAALVSSLPALRAAVEKMQSQPLEDSLQQLIKLFVRGGNTYCSAIAARLGWNGDDPKTLQACGDQLGVTRERIRQIEERFIRRLRARPRYVPQLDRAVTLVEKMTPCLVEAAKDALHKEGVSGRPFSPVSLIGACQLFGRSTGLKVEEHDGKLILVSGEQGKLLGIVTRSARKLAGQSGVSSIYQVVDAVMANATGNDLLEQSSVEVDVRRILSGQASCEFLDDDWFWYTDIPEGKNRLQNVVTKILSVAAPQSIASIREGVRRLYRWRSSSNRRLRTLTVPPQAVLTRFFQRHPDFILDGEMVSCAKPLDYRKMLAEGEQVIVDVLRGVSTGVVDRRTLVDQVIARGINENTLSIYTSYSPILEHIGIGLWKLRGVKVDPAAVEAVREQNALRPKETRLHDFGWSHDGRLWIAWTLPPITGSNVLAVPSAVRRFVANREFAAEVKGTSREIGAISVNEAGSSYGYSSFFRYIGADEGDLLLAEFDLGECRVSLSINDDATMEELAA